MLWRSHGVTGTTSYVTPGARRLSDLAGVRLGKHERRILVEAPSPSRTSIPIGPAGSGRSASEAHRRALRKLDDVGLIDYWHICTTSGKYLGNKVRRTPLGQAVIDRYRNEIESGLPIRWPRRKSK